MGFFASSDVVWTIPPDWSSGVQETLAWSTDIMQASATAVTQHRALRSLPRRALAFTVGAFMQRRRAADMLLAGHSGLWQLPVWHDVQWLGAPLASGVSATPCVTAGYDFVAGGKALLFTAVNTWEVVTIAAIASDQLTLTAPTVAAYGIGARLYPLRAAYVRDGAEEKLRSDTVSQRTMTFDIAEPCDWPLLASPTLYLGHVMLDVRPDESTDPTSSYSRLLQTVDYGTGLPVVHDLPGLALRTQQSSWQLFGRAQHTWFRSLLYTLDGRRVPLWVPSFASDLQAVSPIAGSSTSMTVEWAGYTQFGKNQPNRKDLRIELFDGTVLYRRITAALESDNTEILTLDSALASTSVDPANIRAMSFMALSTLASDSVDIDHATDQDGVATAITGWQAVVPDV
ncbi:MAG: hypothetical protein ABI114_11060 [Rhodanobacter sp.]